MATETLFRSSLVLPALSQTQLPPEMLTSLCPSDVPLALLPVRLETRFFRVDNAMELWIRVYPDKIHVDSHETLLTVAERDWGRHFWDQVWRSGRIADTEARAWRQLAERYGPERAGWIARQSRPTNLDRRPEAPVPANATLNPAPAFPNPPTAQPGDDAAWRRAPQARLLPERWIAVAYHNGQVALTASGKPIVQPLAVGPDPGPTARVPPLSDETLAIDDDMRWMVDFDQAEAKGMGLRMALTPTQVAGGIQALIVFGVCGALPAADGAAEIRVASRCPPLHRRPGVPALRCGDQQHDRAALGLQQHRDLANAHLRERDRRRPGRRGDRRLQRARTGERTRPGARCRPRGARSRAGRR